jgi:hypothetical protein
LKASDSSTDRQTAAAIDRWMGERSVFQDLRRKAAERTRERNPEIKPTR